MGLAKSMAKAYKIYLSLLGILFFCTSILHFHRFASSNPSAFAGNDETNLHSLLLVIAVPVQAAIGVALILFTRRKITVDASTALIALYACYNLLAWWRSSPSCACLEVVTVPPSWMLVLDIALLSLLVVIRHFLGNDLVLDSNCSETNLVMVCSGIVLGALLITAPISRVQAKEQLIEVLQPSRDIVRRGTMGSKFVFFVEIKNNGTQEVELIGGTANCSCITLQELPCTVAAGEVRLVPVQLFTSSSGDYKVTLFAKTDVLVELHAMIKLTVSDTIDA